ncbi:MAG: 5'-methylthioadenosine phosphorylase [Planctomycetes bacterium]|nr:5'-methylthioadenosine phosphorylase [Planctomycetota bacterium]
MAQPFSRTIALIGGTGLAAGLRRLPLSGLQLHQNVSVRFGANQGRVLEYLEGCFGNLRVIVLPRHGPTLERPDRSPGTLVAELGYEAHIWLLHELGVSAVYAFSTVGALDLEVPLASQLAFVVPHDYGRGIGATTHSFGSLSRTIHPSMREPFDRHLRDQFLRAIQDAGASALTRGLYIYNGPDQFETDAEIRALRRFYDGESHRIVGMTAGPELVLCRQMEIPYAVVCANSNYAQGLVDDVSVTHELVLHEMQPATAKMLEIATHLIRIVAEESGSVGNAT